MKKQPPTGKSLPYIYLTKDLYLEYIKNYYTILYFKNKEVMQPHL